MLDHGRAYVVSEDRNLYALDLKTGREIWHHALEDYATAPPLVYGDTMIVADRAGDLLAVHATTGKTLWQAPLGGTPFSRPMLWNGDVVLKIGDHAIAAYAASTGALVWHYIGRSVVTEPVVTAAAR